MDDPRSVLETIYFFMFMQKFMRTFLFRIAHCDPEEPSTKICTTPCLGSYVDILYVVLDRGQKTINSWTLRMTPGGESSVNLGMLSPCGTLRDLVMPCEALWDLVRPCETL